MIYDVILVKYLELALLIGLFFPNCETRCLQNSESLSRRKRHNCGGGMFGCENGECISMALVCNGKKNCKDGSDEAAEPCIISAMRVLADIHKCPLHTFQCDNGNCIHTTKRCDGKEDCSDVSDEKNCQSPCRSDEFKCASNSCLTSNYLCNGIKDCEDGSDETFEQCQFIRCADDQFKCAYGACIQRRDLCDNKMDCVDASDENAEICKVLSTSSLSPQETKECILPPQPDNGEYEIGGCSQALCNNTPGTAIGNLAILNYTCHSGYVLSGSHVIWCKDAIWSSPFPTCNKALCQPLMNPSRRFECKLMGSNVNCSEPMLPETKAIIHCEVFYTASPELSNYDIICLENGDWSRVVHSCSPECGLPNYRGLPFISNGRVAKLAEFPWHVGIYQISDENFHQKCGGSLVGSKIIITAAHCFWNENESKIADANTYRITAGKFYRDWQKRTDYFQEVEIEEIKISKNFKGIKGLYAEDIAVVILKTNFVINEAVRPICLDLDQRFSEDFKPGKMGVIVGWGFTENQIQSEELHTIMLPYEKRDVCIERSKESFIQFLNVHDKFCVGTNSGKSVCPGDSGGGFAVKFQNDSRYYLMGIVSTGVAPEGKDNCDISQYTSFTKVSDHYWFIREFTSISL